MVSPRRNKKTGKIEGKLTLQLNLAALMDSFVNEKAAHIYGMYSDTEFKRWLIKNILDEWTRTMMHELVHMAQAVSTRVSNPDIYSREFMPRRYTNRVFKQSNRASNLGTYLGMTQEIQAHAASSTMILAQRYGKRNTSAFLDTYERWIKSMKPEFQPPDKMSIQDKIQQMMGGGKPGHQGGGGQIARSDIEAFIRSEAPRSTHKFLYDNDDYTNYAYLYSLGIVDKKAMRRFIRDAKRTLKDMK